ncbi:MAG: hypothetical protein SFZ03_00940 [Candidatus Melainabacteria bacterium]|nr:hypothetical protein [Candidatus Melainabacteria bacterium]
MNTINFRFSQNNFNNQSFQTTKAPLTHTIKQDSLNLTANAQPVARFGAERNPFLNLFQQLQQQLQETVSSPEFQQNMAELQQRMQEEPGRLHFKVFPIQIAPVSLPNQVAPATVSYQQLQTQPVEVRKAVATQAVAVVKETPDRETLRRCLLLFSTLFPNTGHLTEQDTLQAISHIVNKCKTERDYQRVGDLIGKEINQNKNHTLASALLKISSQV